MPPISVTTPVVIPAGFDRTAFDAFVQARDEPGWIVDRRRHAFECYLQLLETRLTPEEWKRIDLRAFRPGRFRVCSSVPAGGTFQTLMEDRAAFSGVVSHVDGLCTRSTVSETLSRQGVLFGDLATLLPQHRDLLEPHLLKRGVYPETDRFSAWHAAFWTGGTVLYVPAGVTIEEPLYSLIALSEDGAADFSHTLVVLEDGASATLLEETASANSEAAGLHVGAVELLIGQEAKLRYVQLQNWNEEVWHFAHQAGCVDADGSLQWTVGGLGAKVAHIHQDVHLNGRGAEAEVNGVTFAVNRQVLSYYTQQSHNAPDTRSDLLYKNVLRDRSRVVWRGMIRVEPEAQRTDGYQRNDALHLSPNCRTDAIPGLEIEADDVKCTHGATAGCVDQDQVFYAMCRGLAEYEAMNMIVQGFFQTVSDRIPVPLVRDTLDQSIQKKLGIGD